jgi:release factor glutamine methyltransferase
MKSIQELCEIGKSLLGESAEGGLESKVLLCKSAAISEEAFHSEGGRKLGRREERMFLSLVSKRRAGVPLSYLTNRKEFWSLEFEVYPGVLIPRPETELVVEKVLEISSEGSHLKSKARRISKRKGEMTSENHESSAKTDKKNELIADIGTGSGNIAIALARELPKAVIVACDTSRRALKVARLNALNLGVSNVIISQGSVFTPLDRFKLRGKCDFIVSNPPYIARDDWDTLQREIRDFEPKRALVAGETGLEFIRKLVGGAPAFLRPGGYLVFEIGYGQAADVMRMFDRTWRSVRCFDDLSHIPRVIVARMEGSISGRSVI